MSANYESPWNNSKRKLVVEYWAEGCSENEIARRLGVLFTKNAVASQIERMRRDGWDVPARDSPIVRKASTEAQGTVIPLFVNSSFGAALKSTSMNRTSMVCGTLAVLPSLVGTSAPGRIGIVGPASHCQFPLWGDKKAIVHRFCDEPSTRGSYCERHATQCYTRYALVPRSVLPDRRHG